MLRELRAVIWGNTTSKLILIYLLNDADENRSRLILRMYILLVLTGEYEDLYILEVFELA